MIRLSNKFLKLSDRIPLMGGMLCLIVVLACVSCSTPPPLPPATPSGFLRDYSQLIPIEEAPGAFVYTSGAQRLTRYKMVIIEKPRVIMGREPQPLDLDPGELDGMALQFENELTQVMSDSYPVTQQPGFGVLRVRTAITNVFSYRETDAHPVLLNLEGAAIEAEFIDSLTGKRVVAFVDTRPADDMLGSFRLVGQTNADERIKVWARVVRDRLDQARGLYASSTFPLTGAASAFADDK